MNKVKTRKVMFVVKIMVIIIILSFSLLLMAPSSIEALEDSDNRTVNKSFPSLTPYIMGFLGYHYNFIPYSFTSSIAPSHFSHFFNYYNSPPLKDTVGTVIFEIKDVNEKAIRDIQLIFYQDELFKRELKNIVTINELGQPLINLEFGEYWVLLSKDQYYDYLGSFIVTEANNKVSFIMERKQVEVEEEVEINEELKSTRNKGTARIQNPATVKLTEVKDENSLKTALIGKNVEIISFEEDISNDGFTASVKSQTIEGNGKTLYGNFTIEADDVTIKNLTIIGDFRDNGTSNVVDNIIVNSNSPGGNVTLAGDSGTVKDTVIQNDLTLQGTKNKINNSNVGGNVIITGNENDYRDNDVKGTFLYSVNGQTFPKQAGVIVEGLGLFEEKEQVTIKAEPKEGWEFLEWNSDEVFFNDIFSMASTFKMPDKPVTVTAIFQEAVEEEYAPITLNISGKVVDSQTDDGIQGALVYIESADGFIIETITNEDGTYYVAGLNPGTYTLKTVADGYSKVVGTYENLDEDIYVEIDLEKIINHHHYYDLVLTIKGQGQTNLEARISHTYKEGENVILVANPLEGWKFDGWRGDLESNELEVTVTMDEAKLITANFVRQEYTVFFKDYDNTEIKVEKVKHGDNATPPPPPQREGYDFYRWEPSESTNIIQDLIVTALYKEIVVENIEISSLSNNKTVYNEGENLQLDGLTVILNKTDDSTEKVEFWEFETKGLITSLADDTPLLKETEEVIITHQESNSATSLGIIVIPLHEVVFDTEGEGGKIKANTNGTKISSGDLIAEGSTITFTALPEPGLEASRWTINGEVSSKTGNTLTIEEIDSDQVVKVGFDIELIPIATVDELKQIEDYGENTFGYGTSYQRYYSGGYHKNYFLVNDIDLSQENFEPIGFENGNGFTEFSGTFDGRGYKIHNGTIDFPEDNYIGLFASASSDAVIENIGLVNLDVTGKQYVGSLVGQNDGSIKHSYSSNYVESTFTGMHGYIGGLVGANENDGVIKKSYNTGSTVTGHTRQVGGLVGDNRGVICESYNTGSLTGDTHLGGLVGRNGGRIVNSYNTGPVTGLSIAVGGLVGHNRNYTVKNSYSSGPVIGSGGLIGASDSNPTIINSYWDKDTSGKSNVSSGEGKETSEMKKQETFIEWDFDGIWGIKEGETYPYLKNNLQNPLPKPPPS